MHFPKIFLSVAAPAILLAQTGLSQNGCPTGEHESTDSHGAKWCMDSEGRSYKLDDPKAAVVDLSPAPFSRRASDLSLPPKMRMCAGGHCFTLRLREGEYRGVEDGSMTEDLTLSVVRFTQDQVKLNLQHINGAKAVLAGKIASDADVLIDDDFKWIVPPKDGVPFNMMWGKAIACNSAAKISITPDLAYGYAFYAYLGSDYVLADCWAQKSSDLGNARGDGILGLAYANGNGVPKNEKLAFDHMLKSAERGNPTAQALMAGLYEVGSMTVPRNPERAAYWKSKAMESGEGRDVLEKQQQKEQAIQRQQVLISQQQGQTDQQMIHEAQIGVIAMMFSWVLDSAGSDDHDDSRPHSTMMAYVVQQQNARNAAAH